VSGPPQKPGDEELEELGDEVILAQESAVHAPQPRQNVATDQPSVVISEPQHPPAANRAPTMRTPRRGSGEKTVVIRDRRKLDAMRQALSDRYEPKPKPRAVETKTLYLLVVAALASLIVGTLVAAFVDSQKEPVPKPSGARSAVRPAPPPREATPAPLDTVDLESLPIDKRKPHKRTP
jgi:hypothetical protein